MSIFSTFARVLALAVIVSVGCPKAWAEPVAADGSEVRLASAEAPRSSAPDPQPAMLASSRSDSVDERVLQSRRIFGLQTFFPMPADFLARWEGLRSRMELDEKVLAQCRVDYRGCPAAAQKFMRVVELARDYDGRARIGQINRAVNLQIRPESDEVQYRVPDYWASPLETFASGAGDCEDYAIAKYLALQLAGFARSDLRLVVVRDVSHAVNHAVVAVRHEGQWLLLDNRTFILVGAKEARYYRPLFVMGDDAGEEPRIVRGRLSFEATAVPSSPAETSATTDTDSAPSVAAPSMIEENPRFGADH